MSSQLQCEPGFCTTNAGIFQEIRMLSECLKFSFLYSFIKLKVSVKLFLVDFTCVINPVRLRNGLKKSISGIGGHRLGKILKNKDLRAT